jgi:hypothetical protein
MGFRVEHLPQLRALHAETLRRERNEAMINRMLTPSELITFAVRNADAIKSTWGGGATDQSTPALRRRLARDESRADRERVPSGGRRFLGAQGQGRPASRTPEYATNALDQDRRGELMEFLRERLSPEDYEACCAMLKDRGDGEDDERAGERESVRMDASCRRSDEDYSPASEGGRKGPAKGRPAKPAGAAADALSQALRSAARIAVSSYPTASQIAAERRAAQIGGSRLRLAADAKRPAARSDTLDSFAKRWPDAARIRLL